MRLLSIGVFAVVFFSGCSKVRPKIVECEMPPAEIEGVPMVTCAEQDKAACCLYAGPWQGKMCKFAICETQCSGEWQLVARECVDTHDETLSRP